MTAKASIQVAITPPNFQYLAINLRGTTPWWVDSDDIDDLPDAFTDKRELWEMVATCTARSCISAHYSSLALRVVADWVEQRMEQAAANGWNYEPWRIVNDLRIAAHTADAAIEADEALPRWPGEMQ